MDFGVSRPRGQGDIAALDVAVSPKKATRRFLTLDALRGVGAIAVMGGHAGIILNAYMPPFMYLAVDMFFVLSGFVLAHAYDGKFADGMSVPSFLRARIARLYPVYLIGLVLGLVSVAFANIHALSPGRALLSFFFGIFALPSPPMGALGALFPLNGPFWSLFFEFWVANLIFALFWRQLQGRLLWAMILGSASVLAFSWAAFRHPGFRMDLASVSRWHRAGVLFVFCRRGAVAIACAANAAARRSVLGLPRGFRGHHAFAAARSRQRAL